MFDTVLEAERLVNIMGGTAIESESERLVRIGREEGIKSSVNYAKNLVYPSQMLSKTNFQVWSF